MPTSQTPFSDFSMASTTNLPTNYPDDNGTQCFSGYPECVWVFHGEYKDLTQLASVYTVFIVAFVVIIALGIAGNAMVIGVVWSNRAMRTPTNYYIVSLAVSDLLVIAFVMPLKLVEFAADVDHSIFNTVLCSFTAFVMPSFVLTSIWTLVAISIDRYLVIIHPLRARSFNTRSRAVRIIAIIWIAPFFVLSPYFYPYDTMRYYFKSDYGVIRRLICTDRFMEFSKEFAIGYNIFLFGVLFLVPVCLLGYTCGSIAKRLMSLTEDEKMLKNSVRKEEASRRKVAKMVLVVVFCFSICWSPLFIVSMLAMFTTMLQEQNYIFTQLLIHLCGFANSFMNPVIYALMSHAFRRGFWEILTVCCPQYRDLVAPGRHRGERRSVTAVSQTEVTDRAHAKRGYNRILRRESTQFSAVSDQDEDNIGMTKLGKGSSSSHNNNRILSSNQPGHQDAERKQRAERLLHKFLDEDPPQKLSDIKTISTDLNRNATALSQSGGESDLLDQTGHVNKYIPSGNLACGVSHGIDSDCKDSGKTDTHGDCCDKSEGRMANIGEIYPSLDKSAQQGQHGTNDQPTNHRNATSNGNGNEKEEKTIRYKDCISKCTAWNMANDATAHQPVTLMINEDVPDSHIQLTNAIIPHIAIHSTASDVIAAEDCIQDSWSPAHAHNGPISTD